MTTLRQQDLWVKNRRRRARRLLNSRRRLQYMEAEPGSSTPFVVTSIEAEVGGKSTNLF